MMTVFYAYTADGLLRHVGVSKGNPPAVGSSLNPRWVIAKVETVKVPKANAIAFVTAESAKIAR